MKSVSRLVCSGVRKLGLPQLLCQHVNLCPPPAGCPRGCAPLPWHCAGCPWVGCHHTLEPSAGGRLP
eukprot:6264514-Alexandrium_andersonii.AAC.1